jgi:hypothetical protein
MRIARRGEKRRRGGMHEWSTRGSYWRRPWSHGLPAVMLWTTGAGEPATGKERHDRDARTAIHGRPCRHTGHERSRVCVRARPDQSARCRRRARGRRDPPRAAHRAGRHPPGGRLCGGCERAGARRRRRSQRGHRGDGARGGGDRSTSARRGPARRDWRAAVRAGRRSPRTPCDGFPWACQN